MKMLPSIGSLLDRSFELYFKNARGMMTLSALYLLSLIPFIIGTILAPGSDVEFLVANGLISPLEKVGLLLNGVVTIGLHAFIGILVTICIILASAILLKKGSVEPKSIIREGTGQYLFVFLVRMIQFCITILPALGILPGFLLIWFSVNQGLGVLTLLGIFLFFFGLIFAVTGILTIGIHLQFSQYTYLVDRKGLLEALTASRDLVKGRFLAVLVRLFVPKAIIFIGFFISQLVAFLLLTVLFFYLPVDFGEVISKIADSISRIVMIALIVIWFPLFTVTDAVLYHDLKDSRS